MVLSAGSLSLRGVHVGAQVTAQLLKNYFLVKRLRRRLNRLLKNNDFAFGWRNGSPLR